MCGIAGILGDGAREVALLSRMGGRLRHRGPDDEGVWLDAEAGVGLGHRRLAIVDLSAAGHQPMLSRDGRYVLTLQRRDLQSRATRAPSSKRAGGARRRLARPFGHRDPAPGDRRLGARSARSSAASACSPSRLWDRKAAHARLVRDRFGEKPLYYGWAGRDFVFGSELKALARAPAVRRRDRPPRARRCSRRAATCRRRCRSIAASSSSRPAASSTISRRRPRAEPPERSRRQSRALLVLPRRAFAPASPTRSTTRPTRWTSSSERLPTRSPARRWPTCRSAPSSRAASIPRRSCALYQKSFQPAGPHLHDRLRGGGVQRSATTRAPWPRHLGTDHTSAIVTAREAREVIPLLPDDLRRAVRRFLADPDLSWSARFAREQVTVALSGDGGDELFGGYNRYFATARAVVAQLKLLPRRCAPRPARRWAGVPPRAWNRIGSGAWPAPTAASFGAKTRKGFATAGRAPIARRRLSQPSSTNGPERSPVLGARRRRQRLSTSTSPARPTLVRMMYCDAVSYLPDDILCKVDRASMAVSLEIRVPFLDHRVAELAARIPLDMKIRGRHRQAHPAPAALPGSAAASCSSGPRRASAIPVGEWLQGTAARLGGGLARSAPAGPEGWFDPAMVERRWQRHILSGTADSTAALWSILMFQAWQEGANAPLAAAIPLPLGNSRGQVH